MDHAALFNAVKERNTEQLHKVLGPTLTDFGSARLDYWDHAEKGILTSLNKLPGVQGYDCLRWAESALADSFNKPGVQAPDLQHAERVYRLRSGLLDKALERLEDFGPGERAQAWQSLAAAIAGLVDEVAQDALHEAQWILEMQSRASKEGSKYVS